MKIVPLKNKTVEYVCNQYGKDSIFELKIFDLAEGIRFYELAQQSVLGKPKEQEKAYIELIELGLKSVKNAKTGKAKKLDKLILEWFIIKDLADEITVINSRTVENVKK